ncbi:MAG: hypothetical protein H8E40_03385 [Chloroflexi bacterium]|nr:hypothetical protein [Chloroflexota bacterium]
MASITAHFFHWPSFREYQQNLLQVIALPIGARGNLYYRAKWVNKTFVDQIENIKTDNRIDAIFWVLSCKQTKKDGKVLTSFDFTCPIRSLDILSVDKKNDYYHISFVAKEFLPNFRRISVLTALKKFTKIDFGSSNVPNPGVEGGYVYVGPKISSLQTTQTPSLEKLYGILEDIPCSIQYEEGITIREYPIVTLSPIQGTKVHESGLYELLLDREYDLALSYYQGDQYRNRSVYVNRSRGIGKTAIVRSPIVALRKSMDTISVEVECDSLRFSILLGVNVKVPWYRWKWLALIFLAFISIVIFLLFICFFPDSDTKIQAAIVSPLVVLLLSKIWEVLTKKD